MFIKNLILKRVLIFTAIFALILSTSCKSKEDEGKSPEVKENEESEMEIAEEEIDVEQIGLKDYEEQEYIAVWEFPDTENYDKWSKEEPYINPMGAESNYESIETKELEEIYFYYVDVDNYYRKINLLGKTWNMNVPFDESLSEEENMHFNKDLRKYIESKGGEYFGYYDDRIYLTIMDENESHWWIISEIDNNKINLKVSKEKELKPGDSITISPNDYEDYKTYFSSYNDGDYFQSVIVEFDRKDVFLKIEKKDFIESYDRTYRYSKNMYEEMGTKYVLDDALFGPGRSYWEVSWEDDDAPGEISIKLENVGNIPSVKDGEELGGIQIKSERISRIDVYPLGGTELNHPEFEYNSFSMDRTPEGDYLAVLPSGYYDLVFYPSNDQYIENYKTVVVPVNAGEITQVNVPLNISQSLSPPKVESREDKGILISNIIEENDSVNLDFSLVDSETKEILPSIENTNVYEGSKKVEISNIERVKTPPTVALLVDSSGSMEGVMDQALNSAKEFINTLPENSKIILIDFDTGVKTFKGTTKAQAIENIDKITQGGSTALYDAVVKAIETLESQQRPTVVAFTDGEDGIHSTEYSGSTFTKEETIEKVKESKIPLYTIGFREEHDGTTLKELAEASKGKYYSAENKEALDYVFKAINDKLSSTFNLTYERPKESSIGDVPTVVFVLDVSGSMDSQATEDSDYRLDDVKNLYHDFILALPKETQIQFLDFSSNVKVSQAMTTDKSRVLRALGELQAISSTDILSSVEGGYESLKSAESSKKIMIYLTDAALGVGSSEKKIFQGILDRIKEDKINILWVGLGIDEDEDFKYAAEKSGGDYIIAQEVEEFKDKYNEVLKNIIETPQSESTNITINIEKYSPLGEVTTYSQNRLVKLSPIQKTDEIKTTQTVNYEYGKKLERFNLAAAELLSGDSIPGEESIISKRIDLRSSGKNEAALIEAEEIIYMNKLKGVEPPSGKRFLALVLNIENILEKQEVLVYPDGSGHPASWVGGGAEGEVVEMKIPYMIPNFTSHFYLGYNSEGMYPAASVTWLAEDPIALPGDYSITLNPDSKDKGVLIFLVPKEEMQQSSLHFYDTNYGHINIPLVGKMEVKDYEIENMPEKLPQKISDSFSLEINGYEDFKKIQGMIESEEDTSFRVVEGNFISNMQALLQLEPAERFLLKMPTESGDFYFPLSSTTNIIPAGFYKSRKLSPGSFNLVRWAFQIPDSLKNNSSEIFVDLQGEDKTVKIFDGDKLSAAAGNTYKTEYVDIIINNLKYYPGYIQGIGSNKLVLDITVKDKKDGYASTGIPDIFLLENLDHESEYESDYEYDYTESAGLGNFAKQGKYSDKYIEAEYRGFDHLLAFGLDTPVYDGTSRRGFLVFDPDEEYTWVLKSPYIEDLEVEIQEGSYPYDIFGEKNYYDGDSYYESDINKALNQRIEKYRKTHPEKVESYSTPNTALENAEAKKEIHTPMVSYYGEEKFNNIKNIKDIYNILKDIKYIPLEDWKNPFEYRTSKEAMISQGYGSSGDMANFYIKALGKLGYKSKRKIVTLTDKGKEVLKDYSEFDELEIEYLPAVEYYDKNKEKHTLVFPFLKEIDKIHSLVYIGNEQEIDHTCKEAYVKVYFQGLDTDKNKAEQIGDISDSLAGDTGEEKLIKELVFNEKISLDELSLDSVDITINKDGYRYGASLLTAGNKYSPYEYIDIRKFETRNILVEVEVDDESLLTHKTSVEEDMNLEDIFHTISINAPDLKEEALISLENKGEEVHKGAENPDELSALRWYTRSILNKFIGGYSQYEREAADSLNLLIGRRNSTKTFIVTVKAKDKIETNIDLMKISNQIHRGEQKAVESFNIMTGIFASQLESKVLFDNGYGFWEVWEKRPEDSFLVLLDKYSKEKDKLKDQNYNVYIQNRLKETYNYVLIQSKATIINGEKRWAWLEINPETYETIGYIDTGERGSFVEQSIMEGAKNAAYFAVGAFKGVETSIWSVSGFSLQLDNYDDIKEAAKNFALGLSGNFSVEDGAFSMGVGGTPQISQTIGPINISFDKSGAGISEDILGFVNGYKAGVEYYFNNID